ncbi:MAG: tRNA pseudouridine(38-40) synthase TruA [Fusobacteriaceae bacterium]
MNNYMFVVKYDGTKYKGWQRLPDAIETSIQGRIERVISRLLEEEVEIVGSGRTDAGVHALGQVCNFRTKKELQNDFIIEMNKYLPKDISVVKFEKTDSRFHARYNAKSKTYMYRIDNTPFGDPFLRHFTYHVEAKLDLKKMRDATKIFLGTHDFTSFSKNNGKKKSCVRTVESIEIIENAGMIEIYCKGDGFLYNMVRMIAGSLIGMGLNTTSIEEIEELLLEKSRTKHRFVVPPQGLFLIHVNY